MKTRLPWMPRYVRDLGRDCIDPDTLPDTPDPITGVSPRHYYLQFLSEFYNARPEGISSNEHIAEANRRKAWDMRQDLFSAGFRVSGEPPDISGDLEPAHEEMERPAVLAILTELRALRPMHDPKDGRRRPRFASQKAERRFYELRTRLTVLLENNNDE